MYILTPFPVPIIILIPIPIPNFSMSFKDKAQLISQEYKTLDETQKAELDAKCALDKIAYEQRLAVAVDEEMSLLKEDSFAAGGGPIIKDIQFRDLRHSTGITLPLAKVKRIIKGNPEVKNISKEGATFITKATEVFLSYIALKGMSTSALRGGKSIQEKDFIHMVHSTPMCEFLKDDFPRRQGEDGGKSRPKPKQGEQGASLEDKLKASKENRMANAAAGTGKLSSFFGSGSGSGSGGGGGSSISANAELVGGSASKNKNKKKGSPSASVSATVASKSSPARAMSASERFFSTSVSVSELESAPASASQSMGGLDIREQETMHMSMSMEDEE